LASHPVDDLLRLHQGFSQGYDDVVRAAFPRAALEMLLIRLSQRPPLVPIDDLLDRLVQLEKRLRQAGAHGGAVSGAGNPVRASNSQANAHAAAPNTVATRPVTASPANRREPTTASPSPRPSGGDRSSDDDPAPGAALAPPPSDVRPRSEPPPAAASSTNPR